MTAGCPQCGAALRPEIHFCLRCGAPTSSIPAIGPAAGSPPSRGAVAFARRHRLALAVAVAAVMMTVAGLTVIVAYRHFFKRVPPAPPVVTAPDPAPVTAAAAGDVASLTELATEFEALQKQANAASAQIGQLLTRYHKKGGTLPPNFGPDLTDEQRALLAARIQQERSGVRNLLQEILDRNQELRDLRQRSSDLQSQLPPFVEAQEGTRHDRVAMDFLIKQGISTERAYQLVSQINLQDTLLPGFRVWTYYRNGQFGTWITQGAAALSPQDYQRQIRAALESERDQAKQAAAAANARAESASAETGALMTIAEAARAQVEQERAQAAGERALVAALEKQRSTVRYLVGVKKTLVQQRVISGNMRQILSFDGPGVLTLDTASAAEIRVDGTAHGLARIRKISLLPQIFDPAGDLQITIDGAFAVVRLLNVDKFRNNQFVIVLE